MFLFFALHKISQNWKKVAYPETNNNYSIKLTSFSFSFGVSFDVALLKKPLIPFRLKIIDCLTDLKICGFNCLQFRFY